MSIHMYQQIHPVGLYTATGRTSTTLNAIFNWVSLAHTKQENYLITAYMYVCMIITFYSVSVW